MRINFEKELKKDIFKIISQQSSELKMRSFVVGGYVRDSILKRETKDIDIVVLGDGIAMAESVAHILKAQVNVFKNFGTAMIKYKDIEIEFVGARKESYRASSRNPIVSPGTLEEDQNRRDFTINAMSVELTPENFGQFLDPFNGVEDLKNKIIRTPLDPELTFSDDPLRMMRAIRFATQLKFDIEEKTFEGIKAKAKRIKIISAERIAEELNKIILSNPPSTGFELLDKSGLLSIILPELTDLKGVEEVQKHAHKDNFYHTLQVLDNISNGTNNLWLRWVAILHDIGKPATKKYYPAQGWTFHQHEIVGSKMVPKIFKRLSLPSNEILKYVRKLVSMHLRPMSLIEGNATDSAYRRLMFDAGDDIDDLMLLCEADVTSKNPERVRKIINNFTKVRERIKEIEEKDKIRNWQPPISGELIMETFNLKPSKQVGIIKQAITDAILDGVIKNDFDEAYNFMKETFKDLL